MTVHSSRPPTPNSVTGTIAYAINKRQTLYFLFVEKVHMKETKQMTLQLDGKVHLLTSKNINAVLLIMVACFISIELQASSFVSILFLLCIFVTAILMCTDYSSPRETFSQGTNHQTILTEWAYYSPGRGGDFYTRFRRRVHYCNSTDS